MVKPCGPSVRIIIVYWSGLSDLRRCLEALSEQTRSPEEIVVVDNSPDGDCQAEFLKFERVEIIRPERNLGFAVANNRAIFCRPIGAVVFLNPDAFPEPDWLECLTSSAASHSEFAAFGSLQLMDGARHLIDGAGDSYHFSGLFWRNGFGIERENWNVRKTEIFSPCAAAAMVRWDVLRDIGGFDEDFFCYGEDVDLGFRLRLAGKRAILVPDAIVYHVGSGSTGGGRSDFAVYHGHRNMLWIYVKNMPGILFWIFLPCHLVIQIISFCLMCWRGQSRTALRCKRDSLAGLPRMWKKRKKIQRERMAPISAIWCAMSKQLPFLRR